MKSQMHLAVFAQSAGVAQGVWRSPRATPEKIYTREYWEQLSQDAERGYFDAFFVADALNFSPASAEDATHRPDPVVTLAAIAHATKKIGLIGTSSTTYNDPFTVARQFATLDQMSDGRAGWNVVTTAIATAAANYGSASLPPHDLRYERGEEFVDVVLALWEAWEEDAVVGDIASGIWADLKKIHPINFEGSHFNVKGPMPMPRSPQGRLPLAQAGSSGPGMNLGARVGNLIFTTQMQITDSKEFVNNVKNLASSFGRKASEVKVLPGIVPIIGKTEAEARELADEIGSTMSERAALEFMKQSFGGVDLSVYDPDGPFPDILAEMPDSASVSRPKLFVETALKEGLTLRQMAQRVGMSIGHRLVIGTPDQVANDLIEWHGAGAADGFIVIPPDLPLGLTDFVDGVVPRLQDARVFRKKYSGDTLKEHLA